MIKLQYHMKIQEASAMTSHTFQQKEDEETIQRAVKPLYSTVLVVRISHIHAYLTEGRKCCICHGLVHHSFLLHDEHAFLLLAQVCHLSLHLGLLGLLLLYVWHHGVLAGICHRRGHPLAQLSIEVGQRFGVAIRKHIGLFA